MSYVQRIFAYACPNVFLGYLVLAGCTLVFLSSAPGQSF
eukprot:CAMPEP_0113719614 /NCGR_PEP_ID=MMETSP0038_2-20120614/35933_1 /TAXON_ID=2898 /ORGANISM="Cryptomonas paramecium" /LENGTH=38 /DNA_ID=CAMNT_0000648047 /DNA_START=39 /DNA_END=152 /DNA_ORIENTATION=+ /assembly_acc=CAM_ASM_000170